MATFPLDYVPFKSLIGAFTVYYIAEHDGSYSAFTFPTRADVYSCIISSPADIADFLATIQPTAIAVTSENEAAAKALQQNAGQPAPVTIYANRSQPSPQSSDGRNISLPSLFPDITQVYVTGAADDPVLGRGKGALFTLSNAVAGDTSLEFSFADWIFVVGGAFRYTGSVLGDSFTIEAKAAASTVTPNGGGTGNCTLSASPFGANTLIVPSPGVGTHDVDLATAVPITALNTANPRAPIGNYNWSMPDTGKGTVTAGAVGASPYNLFAVAIDPLVRLVNRAPLLGDAMDNVTLPAVLPKLFLPHWTMRATLHNSGHAGLDLAFRLVTARVKTT